MKSLRPVPEGFVLPPLASLQGPAEHVSEAVRDRALGAYLGLAIGDALGATVEFMTPREISLRYGRHDQIIGGGWLRLRPGQVTDDTTLSLALGDAIVAARGFDLRKTADHFADWLRAKPVDVGNTCRRGIQRYMATGEISGPMNEADGGNGACMRNLPVALAWLFDHDAFRDNSIAQSHITHHHPLSDAATCTLGDMARILICGGTMQACRDEAEALVATHPQFRWTPYPGRASGYIVETVQTVLHHFFNTSSFEECVVATVNQGDDADTTGALAGMLAGARFGQAAIPRHWLNRIDRRTIRRINAQTDALLKLAERPICFASMTEMHAHG